MYKRGHDYDYQYDWVLKKAGQKIDENDYADAHLWVPAFALGLVINPLITFCPA